MAEKTFTEKKLARFRRAIIKALRGDGHEVSVEKNRAHSLVVDGTRVSVWVREEWNGFHSRPAGRVTVRVDGAYGRRGAALPARTFKETDKRPLNVAKVAARIAEVAREKRRVSEESEERERRLGEWRGVAARLRESHPDRAGCVEATVRGIEVRVRDCTEREADAVLAALESEWALGSEDYHKQRSALQEARDALRDHVEAGLRPRRRKKA